MYVHVCLMALFCTSGICHLLPKYVAQENPLILTPYIERGETEKAKNLSVVDPSHFAGVNSHAAYFTVNKTNKWHLFFWYFPAQGVKVTPDTPLIIWLQGGPGCTSMFGLFNEIGPLKIKDGKVTRMPITWGSNYSLLFIDNPVGTGFSFTEDPEKYVTNEDMVGECLLSCLQQFLQVFPELRQAPLFIAGESYAGKYIPAFGHYIHNYKNDSMPINLKGLAIGDGWIDPPTLLHYAEWGLQVGLLDPVQADIIHSIEEEARQCWKDNNMKCFEDHIFGINIFLKVYAPVNPYNYLDDSNPPTDYIDFLNKPEIQNALHVNEQYFIECNFRVQEHLSVDINQRTTKPWLEELLEHYGVMCYSGQLDMIIAYALSVHTYQSLEWSGQKNYLKAKRKPLYDEDNPKKINSFVKESGNFLDVMVRSAGHMVPYYQPRAAKQIIDMFIRKFK